MNPGERNTSYAERRASQRARAFLRAVIIHPDGHSRTACLVRDISEGGARIDAPASVAIPEYFELFIPLKGLQHRSRTMWRAGNEIGVSFIPEENKLEAQDPPADAFNVLRMRLAEVELETARLRKQMNEMHEIVTNLSQKQDTG